MGTQNVEIPRFIQDAVNLAKSRDFGVGDGPGKHSKEGEIFILHMDQFEKACFVLGKKLLRSIKGRLNRRKMSTENMVVKSFIKEAGKYGKMMWDSIEERLGGSCIGGKLEIRRGWKIVKNAKRHPEASSNEHPDPFNFEEMFGRSTV